jgi:hypothetical protein
VRLLPRLPGEACVEFVDVFHASTSLTVESKQPSLQSWGAYGLLLNSKRFAKDRTVFQRGIIRVAVDIFIEKNKQR